MLQAELKLETICIQVLLLSSNSLSVVLCIIDMDQTDSASPFDTSAYISCHEHGP